LSNPETAQRLSLGVRTVESYRANLMRKLDLRNVRLALPWRSWNSDRRELESACDEGGLGPCAQECSR
jgi:DNA-binding NarL/FixJ family response regulator